MSQANQAAIPILCVEDEPATRMMLVHMLRQRFSNLFVAKDGLEGLDLFRRHRPALVVTDIRMPRLDGIRMARAIRAERPETRIVITTALDDAQQLLAAIDIGVTDYVIKPLSPPRLFAAIDKSLRLCELEHELRSSKAKTESILESIGDAFFVLDGEGCFTYLNRKAEERFRMGRQGLLGEPFLSLFPEFLPERMAFQDAMEAQESRTFEHFTPMADLWQEVRVFPLDGGVSVYLRDITETKQAEEKILRLAFYDKLTGLPNRTLLQDRLNRAILRTRRNEERCAVLFLDLDGFKNINDSLGHEAGDEVLKEVARRLCASIRDSDTAARLGGDEFVILLEGFEPPDNIHSVTHRILLALAQEIRHGDVTLSVTASIGISFFPEDGDTVEDLLKAADTAMYHGKKRGRNTYQFYRREMTAETRHYLLMDHALRKAIQHDEFMLHFQPQLALETRALVGFEALVRWRRPDQGMTQPGEFIPLAEDTGIIRQIGDWVLKEACRQARLWMAREAAPFRMAVNLSCRQFWQEDLVDAIGAVLAETGLPPDHLELEITESMVMSDVDTAIAKMRELTSMGVRLSIDDFGTGYSSLAALKRFPIQSLKIDKSFIKEVTSSAHDAAIVTAIIALAHTMNLTVVAEGIETPAQLDLLIRQGCEAGQGFLFSQPIPAPEVEAQCFLPSTPG